MPVRLCNPNDFHSSNSKHRHRPKKTWTRWKHRKYSSHCRVFNSTRGHPHCFKRRLSDDRRRTWVFIGRPFPLRCLPSLFQFVWFKDGAPLAASTRLRTRYDIGTKQVLLQINDIRPQDVGEYTVVATNPAGEDSSVCSLSVVPDKPGVDDRAFVPKEKFRDLDQPQGQGRRPFDIVPGVDMQPFIEPERFLNLKPIPSVTKPEDELTEPKRAPKVLVPLVDCDVEEQMPVIFTTTIDAGVPMATVSKRSVQWSEKILFSIDPVTILSVIFYRLFFSVRMVEEWAAFARQHTIHYEVRHPNESIDTRDTQFTSWRWGHLHCACQQSIGSWRNLM